MKKINDYYYYFGEWNVPTRWDEVTLEMYQKLEEVYDGDPDIRDIIACLANKERKDVDELPTEFFEQLLEKIAFIKEKPETPEPSSSIEIAGEQYSINIMEKLKTGEFIDSQMALEGDKHNYALLFAILCRKVGEIYNDEFIANILPERVELFKKQPVMKILPLVNCFFALWKISIIPMALSSKVEEAANLLANDIKTSHELGVGKKLYLKWQMRKLRKSLKSIKSS